MGTWIYDKEEIKHHVIQFYSSMYSCDSPNSRAYLHPNFFPIIDDEELQYIQGNVDDDEIKRTIFGMHPLKAPGLDGLLAIFYKTQWDTVGSSLCCLVKDVFQHKRLPGDLNATLLALIPKSENPSSLKLCCLISLCNVAYKTITKIIANQFQSILPHLIGPHQTSFVPGRHITENIVIAQEVIHSMRKKTGAKGFMAIKVDLEKAYDRLNWEFINDTLCEAQIPPDLIQIIMACITLVKMLVLWNGEVTDEFLPSCGIRQGDPLSHYIFVLCIERLSHRIHNAVTTGKWKPIRLARNGIPLSHLFFADYLLLLAEASIEQARILSAILDAYCYSSEAKVNINKTMLYFSNNVGAIDVARISGIFGYSVTHDLGKYLGVPLHHTRVTNNMFQDIIDKVEKWLFGWNASSLSLVGRITLAQSVLQAIPIYVMQTVSLPTGIREKIDRACMRFIWSVSSPHQSLSMIN